MGIKVGGTREEVIYKFRAKGFTVVKNRADENTVIMAGKAGSMPIELYASFTPISGKCWALTVYLPEQTSWYSLKNQYEEYLEIMTSKYGRPNSSYSSFITPYYEGDGYELSALKLEKCIYSAFWNTCYIQMSKYLQVKIQYENTINSGLLDAERERVNKRVF
jgi:hypothetical protein